MSEFVEIKEKLERIEGRVSSHDMKFNEHQDKIDRNSTNIKDVQTHVKSFEERLEESISKPNSSNEIERRR